MDAAELVRRLPPEQRRSIEAARRIAHFLTPEEGAQLTADSALIDELAKRSGTSEAEAGALREILWRWVMWAFRTHVRESKTAASLARARGSRRAKITRRKHAAAVGIARSRKELALILKVSEQATRDFEKREGIQPPKF